MALLPSLGLVLSLVLICLRGFQSEASSDVIGITFQASAFLSLDTRYQIPTLFMLCISFSSVDSPSNCLMAVQSRHFQTTPVVTLIL